MHIYICADLHLCGFTPVRIYTCADLHLCGFTPARIYKPRGKTPARNYKPRGFTPTAKKHLRGKTTTADLQATRIYTYRGKTPARFSSMTLGIGICTLHLEYIPTILCVNKRFRISGVPPDKMFFHDIYK